MLMINKIVLMNYHVWYDEIEVNVNTLFPCFHHKMGMITLIVMRTNMLDDKIKYYDIERSLYELFHYSFPFNSVIPTIV